MIPIHNKTDLEKMKVACKFAAETLNYMNQFVVEDITTFELNKICHDFIIKNKAIPAPLGYHGFPKSICTSINDVICHGIPDNTKLKNGDIMNLDVTTIIDGWYGDTSRMYCIGNVDVKTKQLVDVTYQCTMEGISVIKPGIYINEIGQKIQNIAHANGFSVVRDYCGHGIGKKFHQEPNVLHYASNDKTILREGMFFTVEPMINTGDWRANVSKEDGWTDTTVDGSLSAQFEHTIAVTKDGFEILTLCNI